MLFLCLGPEALMGFQIINIKLPNGNYAMLEYDMNYLPEFHQDWTKRVIHNAGFLIKPETIPWKFWMCLIRQIPAYVSDIDC